MKKYWLLIGEISLQCEDNYTTSRYIAEFFNTMSNVPFIAIGFYGWWRAMQTGLPQKYALPLLGLSVIGAGSAGFHATVSALANKQF